MNWNAKKGLGRTAMARRLKDLAEYDMNDALDLVGLRKRPSAAATFFTSLGLVLGGMAVGVAVGMLLAPREGARPWARFRARQTGSSAGAGRGASYGAQSIHAGAQGSNLS